MEGLTVHCMVRNEPFVYYAVKSVYDFADVILLYDTGSYDQHTLADIQLLLKEDVANKIVFKEVPIEVDETQWTTGKGPANFRKMAAAEKGKKGKWYCRQLQLDHTSTRYFMILDGDEVWYRAGMEKLKDTMKNWPEGKICGRVSLIWFYDMDHIFNTSCSGRIFLTDSIGITHSSPGELHTIKNTLIKIGPQSDCTFGVGAKSYAHFETWLKPWRRNVHPDNIKPFIGELPEVMKANMSFVERFSNV